MARFHDKLSPELREFIARQHVFFVATAAATGRINLSPKGMNTFRVLDESRVAYLDLTGSGNETAGHIAHDGRLTIMLCSFDEKPLILRLYGRGQAIRPRDPQWPTLISHFTELPGQRQIIVLDIESLQTSCGFGVPQFTTAAERQTLIDWANKKSPEGIQKYWADKNQKTIDGLDTTLLESQTQEPN